jgi:predicted GH43/DUF377 family glycosyl hydrolase
MLRSNITSLTAATFITALIFCPPQLLARQLTTSTVERLAHDLSTPFKQRHLLIAASLHSGDFDSHLADCPFPFYHEGSYWMTYIGWDTTGYRTGIAQSPDLLHWTKRGLLLDRGPVGSATQHNVALTCIARDNDLHSSGSLRPFNGRYIGTYHAYPGTGYESGSASIGICTTTDTRHWDIRPPVLHADPNCAWEAGGLYKSWLLEHDGTWYLFYNAKNRTEGTWKEQTGFATSTDLEHWQRNPGNPVISNGPADSFDQQFASDPCVFRDGDHWVMFYFGLATDGHAREGVAFSTDLHHWTKYDNPLLDIGPPGSIDSIHAHKPGIITRNGVLYHFYCAVSPVSPGSTTEVHPQEMRGITVATSAPVN